jgi:hypothetical protein
VFDEQGSGSPVVLLRNGAYRKVTANKVNVRAGTEMQVKADRKTCT